MGPVFGYREKYKLFLVYLREQELLLVYEAGNIFGLHYRILPSAFFGFPLNTYIRLRNDKTPPYFRRQEDIYRKIVCITQSRQNEYA